MSTHLYVIALGSNMRHPRFGAPHAVVEAAMDLLDPAVGELLARSPIIETAPVGPSMRRYANAAVVLESIREPQDLLAALQDLEQELGRVRRGQSWRARVIDLDIVLWDGGSFASDNLVIPHPLFRQRDFVLRPASAIAADWRDPLTGLTLAQLTARLTRRRPLPR